jgi:galactose oxidase-like protein/Kelch motif protein
MKKLLHLSLLLTLLALLGTGPVQAIQLTPERGGAAETLLPSGKVLITGGQNENAWLNSAVLYDPSRGTFSPTGNMNYSRAFHTSTLLPDGTVLITGGEQGSDLPLVKTAELYNPISGQFTVAAHLMTIAREKHTATLLADGRVLIVGGKQADTYDPSTQVFTKTPNSPTNRTSHAAVTLPAGTVLITGGYVGRQPVGDAWVFTPSTNKFTLLAATMLIPRANHAMTLMLNGKVLVTGGFSGTSPHDQVDIFDPVPQTFSVGPKMLFHRSNHNQLLLPDGRVLVVGGTTLESGFLATNEVYDPNATAWSIDSQMTENRTGCTATLLQNGQVLVAGGLTGNKTLQTAEILDPFTHAFTSLGNMQIPRNQHTDTLLANGRVLLAAGSTDADFLRSAEIFNPANNSFTLTGSLSHARKSHTATLLQDNNRVVVTGGKSATGDLASAEIYDVSTGQFRSTGSMIGQRSLHSATLLGNGTVLVAGGRKGATPLRTAEIFNPATETFASTGMLNVQRKRHAANLLVDGTVLVEGGASVSNGEPVNEGTPTAEIYNSVTATWTQVEDMSTGRTEHTATLLPDGTVMVCGGISALLPSDLYNPVPRTFSTVGGLLHQRQRHVSLLLTNPAWGSLVGKVLAIGGAFTGSPVFGGIQEALDTVELYDPSTGQFTLFGTMTEARQNHTATMLNDGRILIAGGVSSPSVSGTAELITP